MTLTRLGIGCTETPRRYGSIEGVTRSRGGGASGACWEVGRWRTVGSEAHQLDAKPEVDAGPPAATEAVEALAVATADQPAAAIAKRPVGVRASDTLPEASVSTATARPAKDSLGLSGAMKTPAFERH